jgi:hypothetical protein
MWLPFSPSQESEMKLVNVTSVQSQSNSDLNRLEAATSRLEDMVPATAESHAVNGIAVPKGLAAITTSSVTTPPAPPAPPAPPVAPKADPVPESVEDFDTFISEAVTKYVKQSEAIGGSIAKQVTNKTIFIWIYAHINSGWSSTPRLPNPTNLSPHIHEIEETGRN